MGKCIRAYPVEWIGGVMSETCPMVAQIKYNDVFHAWNRLVNKDLPDNLRSPRAGGWTEQPILWIQMMSLLQEVKANG